MQDEETNLPDSQEREKQNKLDKYLWLGFPTVILIWFVYGLFQGTLQADSSFDRLNTLFSGLAFWGVIWAILLQKRELALQRRELELTRREVRGQKEQLEAQNTTLKQQRFENTFFSLVNLLTNLVNSMEMTYTSLGEQITLKSRDCLAYFYREFQREYQLVQKKHPDSNMSDLCNLAYVEFARRRQADVGHYFRTLYNIIKFIASSDIEPKQLYINLVRAQLSSSELALLFYNCLSSFGVQKFKPFVEEFGLLENMDRESLIEQAHLGLYKESAFKSQPSPLSCG